MKCESLWLRPAYGTTRKIPLACFADYPYFFESFEQYNVKMPAMLTVRWKPIRPYLQAFDYEMDADQEFIDYIARMIKNGEAVPPVITEKDGSVFDGRHRTWAAHSLGIKNIPVTLMRW